MDGNNEGQNYSIRDLFLGIGIGLFGNIGAQYLGEITKLSFEEFTKLPITYHLLGGIGTLTFFVAFFWLWIKLRTIH
jgi:uncharacterized BrkB/YihY/UPF0761 family membrane protein